MYLNLQVNKGDTVMIIETEGFYVLGGSKNTLESYAEIEYITEVLSNWRMIEGIDAKDLQNTYNDAPILIHRGDKLETPKVEWITDRDTDLDFKGDVSTEFNAKEGNLMIRLCIVNDNELAVQLITTIFKKRKKIIRNIDFL